jgi:hypothetical protein
MTPERLAFVLQIGLFAWFGLLALFILRGLFNRSIHLDGVLGHRAGAAPVAERLTMVLVTLGYAGFYVVTALRLPLDAAEPTLPDVPEEALLALVGSNGLYLVGKIYNMDK